MSRNKNKQLPAASPAIPPPPMIAFYKEELTQMMQMVESFLTCDHDTVDFRTISASGIEPYSFSEEEILEAHESLGCSIRIYFKLRKLLGENVD